MSSIILPLSDFLYMLPLVAIIGVCLVCFYHVYLQIQLPGEVKMLWSWVPFLGFALELGKRPVDFLCEVAAAGEEIVGVVVGGQRIFFIVDVFSAPLVFKSNSDYSAEEFHNSVLANFFGVSYKTIRSHALDDDLMRKWYMHYLLGDKGLAMLSDRMQDEIYQSIHSLKTGEGLPLFRTTSRMIFKASIASLLNTDAAKDEGLFEAFMTFDKVMPLLLADIPSSFFPSFLSSRHTLSNACSKYTQNMSEFFTRRWKLFTELVNGEKMSHSDAEKYQLAIVWASVGNTMPGTFWALFFLLKHPDAMMKVIEEIKSIVPDFQTKQKIHVSFEQLGKLIYVDCCLTEGLRLSSGSLIMRSMHRATSLTLASGKTYRFRKGDRLGLCPPVLHRDEGVYKNATHYVPDRWVLPETSPEGTPYSEQDRINASQGKTLLFKEGKELPSSCSMLAFGAGLSYCPGRRFARFEVKTLLVHLLHNLDVSLTDSNVKVPDFDGSRAGIGVFPPAEDVLVNVKYRS